MTQDDPNSDSLAADLHIQASYLLSEALVQSENQMRRRVNLLSEIVFETDANGLLVFLNTAWMRVLGHSPERSLGRALGDFILPDDRSIFDPALSNTDPVSTRPLIRMARADGSILWMEMSIDPIPGGGAVGAIHDVTAQRLAQQELEKLSLVASYTDNLVVITDRSGATEWVNRAFTEKTGYTIAELAGMKPGEALQGPDTDPEVVRRIGRLLKEGVSFSAELLNYTKVGAPYWVRMHVTPIRTSQGVIERFVAVQTDSTELRQTHAALGAAKERAESANEAKTQFLANISHEMRTPLNAILGSAELALRDGNDADRLRANVKRISESAEALLRLISDMLDISKIEAGQIDIEKVPFQIRACLQDAVAPFAARARAKGLEFKLMCDEELPPQMLGDSDRLRQIVTNLVENAVKFTERGHIRVEASRARSPDRHGDAIQISVSDSGAGISEDQQRRIFERFVQGDGSTTRRKGGAGLGLSIVKYLVEALGGTIDVRSAPGRGSDFRVQLPLLDVPGPSPLPSPPADPGPGEPRSAPPSAPATGRILIAEDNDANFAVLEALLTTSGYFVERAFTGRGAVERFERFDLILMDVEMPEMDGLEATRRIRKSELANGLAPVPVIAVTAHAVQQVRDSCMSAGCTGYISKPVRLRALLETVGRVLEAAP